MNHLRETFNEINGYPHNIISQTFKTAKHKYKDHTNNNQNINTQNTTNPQPLENNNETKINMLLIPYKGKQGEKTINNLKQTLHRLSPTSETRICYSSTKLSTLVNTKDCTKLEHEHNITYLATCPEQNCNATYLGETGRRLIERFKDHTGRDFNSHIYKHTTETKHQPLTLSNYEILDKNYTTLQERKLSEALYIKTLKPTLNTQDRSTPITLFN